MRSGGMGGPGLGPAGPMLDETPRRPFPRNTFRRVVGLYADYKLSLAVVALLVLVTAALGVVTPLLIQRVIDDALPQQDMSLLIWLIFGMVAAAGIAGVLNLIQSRLNASVGFKVMEDMRHTVYNHLLKQPISFFSSTKTGDIQSRLANDVSSTQLVLTDTVVNILSSITIVAAALVAMLILSWELTIVAVCTLPIFAYLSRIVGARRRRLTRQMQRTLADLTAKTGETLFVSGVIVAKTFGREAEQLREFQDTNTKLTSVSIRQYMTGRGFFVVVQAFFTMAPAFIWLIGGIFIIDGSDRVTLGDIVAFTTIQARLLFPMANLMQRGVEISGSLALFERIFEYMDIKPTIVDPVNPIKVDPATAKGEVVFDNVSFAYRESELERIDARQRTQAQQRPAGGFGGGAPPGPAGGDGQMMPDMSAQPPMTLRGGNASIQPSRAGAKSLAEENGHEVDDDPFSLSNISFTARAGELTALVGPSGSGKTTIGYLASRLYDADFGAVRIDGVNIKDLTHDNLTQLVGVVSQNPFLFHASVRENLLYGRPSASEQELVEASKAAQIHDTIAAMPEGYDSIVGEHGYRLSGGERQRLAIARVILADPRILLLDEATSALDTLSERLIREAIARLREGRTTIAIAHRLSTVIAAHQILVIEGGRIRAKGPHDELIEDSDLYRRLYEEHFTVTPVGAEPVIQSAPTPSPA